jgi:conjugal transfer pilus assembly protein TraU
MKRLLALLMWLGLTCGIGIATAPPAQAQVPGVCTGHFVNPITDVCWGCLFPLSVGGLDIWPGSKPDTPNPSLPICACGSPVPRIGISIGFWEPSRLADVTMKPWCFVNLGGIKIAPVMNVGQKQFTGQSAIGGNNENTGGWQIHWYMYPLISWLELVTDFACLELGGIDIAYITEIDPLWQDSELTTVINPEAVIFANPLAVAACAADCVASSVRLPTDPLFWCAGCQGTMYPMNGNIAAQWGHVQGSRLALARFTFKLHREGILWGSMGDKGLCGYYPMPIIQKSQYRFQLTNPIPGTVGPDSCPPIGAATTVSGAAKVIPSIGEDMGYLVWRKRNCCLL